MAENYGLAASSAMLPIDGNGLLKKRLGNMYNQEFVYDQVAPTVDQVKVPEAITPPKETSMWDTLKNSFNPEGASGKSYAGNVMDAVGTIGSLGSVGLAAYYDRKNYKAQKAQQDKRNAITDKVIASGNQAAINAGNGASYNYQNVLGV